MSAAVAATDAAKQIALLGGDVERRRRCRRFRRLLAECAPHARRTRARAASAATTRLLNAGRQYMSALLLDCVRQASAICKKRAAATVASSCRARRVTRAPNAAASRAQTSVAAAVTRVGVATATHTRSHTRARDKSERNATFATLKMAIKRAKRQGNASTRV